MSLLSTDTTASLEFYVKDKERIQLEEAPALTAIVEEVLRLYLSKRNKNNLFKGRYEMAIDVYDDQINIDINVKTEWSVGSFLKAIFFFPTDHKNIAKPLLNDEIRSILSRVLDSYLKNYDIRKDVISKKGDVNPILIINELAKSYD